MRNFNNLPRRRTRKMGLDFFRSRYENFCSDETGRAKMAEPPQSLTMY
jgi:hypothetical protein